jgi:hypothetical protein
VIARQRPAPRAHTQTGIASFSSKQATRFANPTLLRLIRKSRYRNF